MIIFAISFVAGCTTAPVGVEFSREQCLLLYRRGENVNLLCRKYAPAVVTQEPTAGAPDTSEPPTEPGNGGGGGGNPNPPPPPNPPQPPEPPEPPEPPIDPPVDPPVDPGPPKPGPPDGSVDKPGPPDGGKDD